MLAPKMISVARRFARHCSLYWSQAVQNRKRSFGRLQVAHSPAYPKVSGIINKRTEPSEPKTLNSTLKAIGLPIMRIVTP